jgi:hypothetical protein
VFVNDINYLKDNKDQISNCILIGDRCYLSVEIQLNLFETYNIKLNILMRINQNNYKKQPYIKKRKEKKTNRNFIHTTLLPIYD